MFTRRLTLVIAATGLTLALWLMLTLLLMGLTLSDFQRGLALEMLAPRLVILLISWALALALASAVWLAVFRHYVLPPARLLEQLRVLLQAPTAQQLSAQGIDELRLLTESINQLAAQRDSLRGDLQQRIAAANSEVQQEKNRLAALMAELTQAVVVCNLEGRILLYNSRARLQFKALSPAAALTDGSELIGIGRSIYAVFERELVTHALAGIHQRLERGAASPSTQFVTTTRSGQLLRVQMAPVRAVDTADPTSVNGFVLMLDNVTRVFEEENLRDQRLYDLTEHSRRALANMQVAVDMLAYPDTQAAMRERFLGVVRDEISSMSRQVVELAQRSSHDLKTRWPLEEILGADLLVAAQRHIAAQCQRPVSLAEPCVGLWLRVDSFSLLQALAYLAHRLVDEFDVRFLQLRLREVQGRAQLDLIWSGQAMSSETVMSWEMTAMQIGSQGTPLTVRDVVQRHGGEMWFERERVRHEAFFRFLLPLASPQLDEEPAALEQGRPEFYDFDLFQSSDETRALDERPLSSLTLTVFDTETTGLNPSQGDEIIQIGAVRIVNGKLLRRECFDQLVNPGRLIPAATIPIHGITQEMVQHHLPIETVLPAFHAFAQDTVLVAHNAAFDMKFLQLKEASSGLAFRQPVLDTLLLSALVHPNQESHSLEAIAERFNLTLRARHTALGDALVTAEVLLRLLPLLAEMGIKTLAQARLASQKTYYSRIKY